MLYSFRIVKNTDSAPGDTLLGRILSRTGLYALPQFFNVLRNELSIVGPRPQSPDFNRELMRPGMTGLAQIEMRALPALPDCMVELEYDMYYLKYMSPMMDLFIALQSLKNILLWGGRPS